MEHELVRRRRWLSHGQFLDLVGAANLIPGPNSTEVAIHVGHTQRGVAGLLVAGICFILPAALMVSGIAAIYVSYGKLPAMTGILYGLKPVIIAIVLQAVCNLARAALKTKLLIVASIIVVVLYVVGISEIALLFGAGFVVAAIQFFRNGRREQTIFILLFAGCASVIGLTLALSAYAPKNLPYSPTALFLYFVKIGSVVYGSGYVLLSFLRSDLVERYHWLTSAQLLDAIAVGQITPGPVFTAATFIGYLLGGPLGGLFATVGIFLPAFVFVALSGPLVRKMRDSMLAGCFLDAVNAVAVALMSVVLFQLGQAALIDVPTILIAFISAVILIYTQVNSFWLMACGAAVGLLLKFVVH